MRFSFRSRVIRSSTAFLGVWIWVCSLGVSHAHAVDLLHSSSLPQIYETMVAAHERDSIKVNQNAERAFELNVLTVNAGLLNEWFAAVPEYDRRAPLFPQKLYEKIISYNLDFISIQEVWLSRDYMRLKQMVENLNETTGKKFKLIRGNYSIQRQTGLLLIVNLERVTQVESLNFETFDLPTRPVSLWFSLGTLEQVLGWKRGLFYTVVSFQPQLAQPNVGQSHSVQTASPFKFLMANTHLTPTISENQTRSLQMQAAQQRIDEIVRSTGTDFYIMGGDFNFSPEFCTAVSSERTIWLESSNLYVDSYRRSPFIDAFRVRHPLTEDVGWTWDRENNHLIRTGSIAVRNEPHQRPDMIWLGKADPKSAFSVQESKNLFNEDQDEFVTDHYGVYAKIKFIKR